MPRVCEMMLGVGRFVDGLNEGGGRGQSFVLAGDCGWKCDEFGVGSSKVKMV